jgi:hypothetical protein
MKFAVLLAGLGIAQYALASPMRVVVITNSQGASSELFVDGPPKASDHGMHIIKPGQPEIMIHEAGPHPVPVPARRPCHGAKMRENAIRLSNAFRKALGLPLIESQPMIVGFTAGPNGEMTHHPHHPHHHHHHHHHHRHDKAFLRRIHHALMSLGPWEGRAVAFVLGCGIGVLLRMVWVMSIIAYRMLRGDREPHIIQLVCEEQDAELIVAPPQYIQEKVILIEDDDAKKRSDQA